MQYSRQARSSVGALVGRTKSFTCRTPRQKHLATARIALGRPSTASLSPTHRKSSLLESPSGHSSASAIPALPGSGQGQAAWGESSARYTSVPYRGPAAAPGFNVAGGLQIGQDDWLRCPLSLSLSSFSKLSVLNTRTCPVFRFARDAVLDQGHLDRRVPILIRERTPVVTLGHPLHGDAAHGDAPAVPHSRATRHRSLTVLSGNVFRKEVAFPLYEVKVSPSSTAGVTYEGIEALDLSQEEQYLPLRRPGYWVPSSEISTVPDGAGHLRTLGYRRNAVTNDVTLIASVILPVGNRRQESHLKPQNRMAASGESQQYRL